MRRAGLTALAPFRALNHRSAWKVLCYSAAPTLCGKDFLCKDWLEIDVARQRVQPHRARPSRLAGYLSFSSLGHPMSRSRL